MFSEYLLAKAKATFYLAYTKGGYCFVYRTEKDFARGSRWSIANNKSLLWLIRSAEPQEKHRDFFGRLRFKLGDFEVVNNGYAPYRIERVYPFMRTNAVFDTPFWDETPAFDSWIRAVKFLKEHKGELL